MGETEHAAAQRRKAWEGREGLLEEGALNLAQRTGGGGAWMDRAEGGEKCVSGRESEQRPETRQHQLCAGNREETVCPGPSLFLTGPLHLGSTCRGGGWMAWPHGQRGARHRSEVLMSRTSGQPIRSAPGFPGPGASLAERPWLCEWQGDPHCLCCPYAPWAGAPIQKASHRGPSWGPSSPLNGLQSSSESSAPLTDEGMEGRAELVSRSW